MVDQALFSDDELRSHLVTKLDFAAEQGITPSRVSQYISKGMPVEPNGLIDRDKAHAWIEATLSPKRRKVQGGERGQRASLAAAMDTEKLELLRLDRARRAGDLVERAAVERSVFARFRMERDAWSSWASRVAPVLAAELGCDGVVLATALERLVRQHQAELSDTPFSAAGNA